MRVFWSVLLGYIVALAALGLSWFVLMASGFLDSPKGLEIARPGPFPVTDAWDLAADLAVGVLVVLVTAWCLRGIVRKALKRTVSLPIVFAVVALTGYAPFLAIRPVELSGVVALPVTVWAVRRFAVDSELSLHVSRRLGLSLAIAALALVLSYAAFHPLTGASMCAGSGGGRPEFRCLNLTNSGLAHLKILSIEGAPLGTNDSFFGPGLRAPATLGARGQGKAYVLGPACESRTITVTYRVLGRTESKPFRLRGMCWAEP